MYRKADDDKINRIGYKSAAPDMARTRRRENALRRRRERKMEDLEAKRLKDSLMEYESRLQEMSGRTEEHGYAGSDPAVYG